MALYDDTLLWHSPMELFGTLLWHSPMALSYGTLLWHSPMVSSNTPMAQSNPHKQTRRQTSASMSEIHNAVRHYNYVLLAAALSLTFDDFERLPCGWPVECGWAGFLNPVSRAMQTDGSTCRLIVRHQMNHL